METRTETYTHHQLPSARQGRMKIDSLLNPSDDGPDEHSSTSGSPYSQHATMSSSSHNNGYAHSPGYPPSPNQYWYNRYQGYHDTSPGAASTATTHTSSGSSTSQHHHAHPHSQHQQQRSPHPSSNSQHHHHDMFLSYRRTNGSTHSSPNPYHQPERYDSDSSSSSSSSNNGDRRRPPRPKYEEEEMYFIWYHRIDLCQEWKEVRESFNRQFPSRQRRGFQGIQCKFYRFIKEKKCPTLREQRRMRDGKVLREGTSMGADSGAPRFGVKEWANVWYPWMREEEMGQSQSRMST